MDAAAKDASLTVLGIETSCDETAAALVRRGPGGRGEILSSVVRSQLDLHAAYGGVVPEIAARAHVELLDAAIRQALDKAGLHFDAVDAVAAAAGPGLIGGLIVGVTTGKAIALGLGRPFIAVNHLEAHALTAGLTDGLDFPYLLLLVSADTPSFSSSRASATTSASARRSTMRWAKHSTRLPNSWACTIPEDPRSSAKRQRDSRASLSPGRWRDARSRISLSPD